MASINATMAIPLMEMVVRPHAILSLSGNAIVDLPVHRTYAERHVGMVLEIKESNVMMQT